MRPRWRSASRMVDEALDALVTGPPCCGSAATPLHGQWRVPVITASGRW